MQPVVVAIDGPSGPASPASRARSRGTSAMAIDTGAMYRAVTVYCLRQGIDLSDADAVVAAAEELPSAWARIRTTRP